MSIRRKQLLDFLLVGVSLLLSAFFVFIGIGQRNIATNPKGSEKSVSYEAGMPFIDEIIKQMTLEEKIGQLIIIGIEEKTFSPAMAKLIQDFHVGGIILMGKSVSTANEMQRLINDSKKANELNKIPLIISVDEEGGRVSRMPEDINKLPSNLQIGKRNDEAFSYRVGTYLAEVLHAFGFNMNFAPVLDVNNNAENPVIGNRSFGEVPEQVAKLGVSTMHGLMDNGMISVVKHFPGHGDTVIDSHEALPKISASIERLLQVELVPFKKAIDEGADAVMVAHILFPAIDPEYPSSMSKQLITGLLREEMQFDGVVITDDLSMGAITSDYTIAEATVQSFIAGSDLLLIVRDYENEISAIHALLSAVKTGVIQEERVNESVKRILLLKMKYGVTDKISDPIDIEKLNESYIQLFGAK